MSKPLSILLAVATFVGSALGAMVIVRSIQGDPEPVAASQSAAVLFDADGSAVVLGATTDDAGVTAADLVDAPSRLVPILEPVAVGTDLSIGDTILDPPLLEPGVMRVGGGSSGALPPSYAGAAVIPAAVLVEPDASGEPVAGSEAAIDSMPGGTAPPDTAPETPGAGGDPSMSPGLIGLDVFGGWFLPIALPRFDPCAGANPADDTPEDCPTGYAATFGSTFRTPPPPFMFFARGQFVSSDLTERLTCPTTTAAPGDGEAAMTLFTRTPLTELDVRFRRYGSDDAWTAMPVPASPPDQVAWWNERYETREYDIEWATVPICMNIPRDPAFAYEIDGTATDIFGQPVNANSIGIVPLDDPTMRPPTAGEVVGLSSVATVTARSVPDGMVQFRSRAVTGPADDLQCGSAPIVETGVAVGSSIVLPPGVYDPAYTKIHSVRLPIPPGGQLVVCAQIFPTDNPLRPLATDRLLFSAPTQERPRIVLQGIRRFGEATIDRGLTIQAGFSSVDGPDPCDRWYQNPSPLEPGRSHSVEHTLWECTSAPLPADGAGRVDVPVRLTRWVPMGGTNERRVEEVVVPIRLQPCLDPSGCGRPREWYEIPIPWAGSRLCGSSFGSGGCSDPAPTDGMAVIRVDYPVVAAAAGDGAAPSRGVVTLIDQIDDSAVAGTPRVQVADFTFVRSPADNVFHRTGRLELVADRPLHFEVTAHEGSPGTCVPSTTATSDGFVDRAVFEFPGLCAGAAYFLEIHAVDEAGNAYDLERSYWYSIPPVAAPMTARVDFLGGPDVPTYGFVYRFGVSIDGQNPTAYWWDWTGSRRTVDGCMALAGTSARSRGSVAPIMFDPDQLDVHVRVTVTTTGERDCSGSGATGLGEIVVNGSFTEAELLAGGPLVLETEPGATLPMRLTLTPTGDWRPRAGSS